jgi:hypothetical protein
MKELALISKTTPAVVTFNYAEIDKQLEEVLKKYGGLLFTDETVTECKKTIAELKKGKKSLNDFKIKTKKLLTADITKFENQCKLLSDKFNTVIDPISEQAEQFEIKRKADKAIEIQNIISLLSEALENKYSEQLIMTDSMLNKGTTMKSIHEDLTKQADLLLSEQHMEYANIELIKSKVALANEKYKTSLLENQYVEMLEYKDTEQISDKITFDAEMMVQLAEEKEAERLEYEIRKLAREKELAEKRAEVERAKVERSEIEKINIEKRKAEKEAIKIKLAKLAEEKVVITKAIPYVESVAEAEPEVFTENYKVEGTEEALTSLEQYLNENCYTWSINE